MIARCHTGFCSWPHYFGRISRAFAPDFSTALSVRRSMKCRQHTSTTGRLMLGLVLLVCSGNAQTPATGTITIVLGRVEVVKAPSLTVTVNGAQTKIAQTSDLLSAAHDLTNAINSSNPFVTATISGHYAHNTNNRQRNELFILRCVLGCPPS